MPNRRRAIDAPLDELFQEYRNSGDRRLRNEIVERHLGLADHAVLRFISPAVEEDDLRQVALLALTRAVERFDPEIGSSFVAFARTTIQGTLKRHLRDHVWHVRPPRRLQERHLLIRRAVDELRQTLGRTPTLADIAEHTGLERDDLLVAMVAGQNIFADRLDKPVGSEGEEMPSLGSRLPDHESGYDRVERSETVWALLRELPERDRLAVRMRYWDGCSQSDIAAALGVSQSYVSRMLRDTVARLRDDLVEARSA